MERLDNHDDQNYRLPQWPSDSGRWPSASNIRSVNDRSFDSARQPSQSHAASNTSLHEFSRPYSRDLSILASSPSDRNLFLPMSSAPESQFPAANLPNEPSRQASERQSEDTAAKNRRWRPDDSIWTAHKPIIENLYIKQNWTLDATIAHMGRTYDFHASKKMYNQWFRIWRFRKYVPRAVAQEVQERVAKGKDSEVRIGGAVMNHASVQRSVNRLKAGESVTNSTIPRSQDVKVVTPDDPSSVVPRAATSKHQEAPNAKRKLPRSCWTPSYPTPFIEPAVGVDTRSNWEEMTPEELHQLKKEAATLFSDGAVKPAEYKMRDAISGFRKVLGAMSIPTILTSYQLSHLYDTLGRNEEANTVLNWLTANFIEELGLENAHTINHAMNVAELLNAWSKDTQARGVLRGLFEPMQALCRGQPAKDEPTKHDGILLAEDSESLSKAASQHARLVGERDSDLETAVNADLDLDADIQLNADAPTNEHVLRRLIGLYVKHVDDLRDVRLKTRVRLVLELQKDNKIQDAFDMAKDAMLEIKNSMPDLIDQSSVGLLEAAQELAFFYLDNDRPKHCEQILNWAAERLENSTMSGPFGPLGQVRHNAAAIDFMVQAARRYLTAGREWSSVSPWLERAYGLANSLLGPKSTVSRALDRALESCGETLFAVTRLQKGVMIGTLEYSLQDPDAGYDS